MQITLKGMIATDPQYRDNGDVVFRVAEVVDSEYHRANWFTVIARGRLALPTYEELRKGQRILVVGEMRIRDWDNGEVSGTTVEMLAEHLGRDLAFSPRPVTIEEVGA